MIVAKVSYNPWVKEKLLLLKCCTTHGSWRNYSYWSVVQPMGHGKMIIVKVLYDPWVMGNKLSMTHGLYNIV